MEQHLSNLRRSILAVFLVTLSWEIYGQRPLRPVGEFDMSMQDAALLCKRIDDDKNNKVDTGKPVLSYLSQNPEDCFFFQWIYCPNEIENMESPCGWWEQKPCNYTGRREGHNANMNINPDIPPGMELGEGLGGAFVNISQTWPKYQPYVGPKAK